MTLLAKRKNKLHVETSDQVRGRAIIAEINPFTAAIRLKGTRTRFEISWGAIYWAAVKIAADRKRAAKRAVKA